MTGLNQRSGQMSRVYTLCYQIVTHKGKLGEKSLGEHAQKLPPKYRDKPYQKGQKDMPLERDFRHLSRTFMSFGTLGTSALSGTNVR